MKYGIIFILIGSFVLFLTFYLNKTIKVENRDQKLRRVRGDIKGISAGLMLIVVGVYLLLKELFS